jgi:hypothetical protein
MARVQEGTDRTGWDYDFRRLFFTWTHDITKAPFHDWIEIASREETCGWIFPCDLWAEPDGTVHLLWTERALDTRLRATFFPDAKQSHALNYATLREGKILLRHALVLAEEDGANLIAGAGRFHIGPPTGDCASSTTSVEPTDRDRSVSENRLVEI